MKTLLIEKAKIKTNVAKIRERAGGAAVFAVLKGNAYGLGLLEMAAILRDEGITRFALTDVEDAILLRKSGFHDEEILMLVSTSETEYIEALADYNLVGTIGSQEVAVAMSGIAEKRKTVIEAHVEIDTGMGRSGFLPSELDKLISTYKYMGNIALTGIYTHFYRAFNSEKITRAQVELFSGVIEKLRGRGIEPGLVHAANSAALFRYDFCTFDAVRVGSAITGRIATRQTFGLQKTGVLVSSVAEIRWLPKGCTVGYGGVYKTRSPKRVAVVPVGYADGWCAEKSRDNFRFRETFRVILSALKRAITRKKLYVAIGGARARVLGHVGMLHTVIDVTNIDCAAGDLVVLDANPMLTGNIDRTYE